MVAIEKGENEMICTAYRQIFFLLTLLLHGAHTTLCEMMPETRVPVPCELRPFDSNTLVVTSNADDVNDPTTLRGALANAQAGDVITFDLPAGSDEIILNPNSPLIVDTTVIIDGTNLAGSGSGEQLVIINGDFTGDNIGDTNVCFCIESTAPVTTVKNIIIKQFNGHDLITGSGTDNVELFAYGIQIKASAIGCTITNCTITDIISGENQNAAGIYSEADTCPITDNTITRISSASSEGTVLIDSGDVWGIFVDGVISGACANNVIFDVVSGDSNADSGQAYGIDANVLSGPCTNNTISQIYSGSAILGRSGNVIGMRIGEVGSIYHTNSVMQLSSGRADVQSGSVYGIRSAIVQGEFADNIVADLSSGEANGTSGQVYGVLSGNTFHNNVRNNIVFLLETGNAFNSGAANGIVNQAKIIGDCTYNTITGLQSGSAIQKSGDVYGLLAVNIQGGLLDNDIGSVFSLNATAGGLSSGVADTESGAVSGCLFNNCQGVIAENIVNNLSSGNAAMTTGSVHGIDGDSAFNDIANNVIIFLNSGDIEPAGTQAGIEKSGDVIGIGVSNVSGTCIENLVTDLSSGAALGVNDNSGDVTGIRFEVLLGRLWSNTILRLSSGAAGGMSGNIVGIEVDTYLRGDAANNTVQFVMAGEAPTIGYVRGIWLVMVQYDRLIACNLVDTMCGGNDQEDSFGLAIEMGDQLSICQNTITNLTGRDSTLMHGILLGNEAAGRMVTNSNATDNLIQTILGGNNTNGFGITIVNPNSLGNRILNNSIFEVNSKAINIVDNNVETDAGTIVTAPIIFNWVVCTGNGHIRIDGDLFPHPDFDEDEFLLQFFVSDVGAPPQAMTLIGEEVIEANGSPTQFTVEFKPTTALFETQFITATATTLVKPNKNTSEVSPSIAGCNSARQECWISMIDCIEPIDPCPISLDNAPPLEPPCIANPCGPCPCS